VGRNTIDPDALVASLELDLIDNRIAVAASTVRPFDRQRAKVKRQTRTVPMVRATVKFAPRPLVRPAGTISSRRPS